MTWKPDPILRVLLAWTALTTMIFWLPLVRSLTDGDTYEWGFIGFGGHGRLQGDLWLPALGVALAMSIRWLGWRGARMPFHALLLLWVVPLGAGATWLSITQPEDFQFRGDTLGVDVSLAPVGILLFGGARSLLGDPGPALGPAARDPALDADEQDPQSRPDRAASPTVRPAPLRRAPWHHRPDRRRADDPPVDADWNGAPTAVYAARPRRTRI